MLIPADTNTRQHTAGAYISIGGLYPFILGIRPREGRVPLIRVGGHREGTESSWACAVREAMEETRLRIRPLAPPRTCWIDGDRPGAGLKEIRWEAHPDGDPQPVLVVTYWRENCPISSLMYLAEADELPVPSCEATGILLLTAADVQRVCRAAITLDAYLASGGQAVFTQAFDRQLILEPFLQLRILARILPCT